jgi:hypothetical protein
MVDIFNKYNEAAFLEGITPRTRRSMEWFQSKVNELTQIKRETIFNESERSSNIFVGSMVMFFYDPKYERTLPYYDAFPLTIIIDEAKGGFLGLNLHYLPIDLRAKFLHKLLQLTSDKNFDKKTRFQLTYKYLKSTRETRWFKPCIKRYLTSQIQGNLAIIEAPDWEVATFLPTEDFQKKSKIQVHKISRESIK